MIKKIMVVGFILLAGSVESASAQNTTQATVNEAGHLRIVEIKDRVKSQREEIQLALVNKAMTEDQAKDCSDILDKVEAQVAIIASSDNGNRAMLADDYESYSSFLDVNASLIETIDKQTVVASSIKHTPNS